MNEKPAKNGLSALAHLAGTGDNWVKLATIALIIISGGSNWLETKIGNDFNAAEIQRATQEIHTLYPKLEEAIERQKRMQEAVDQLRTKP